MTSVLEVDQTLKKADQTTVRMQKTMKLHPKLMAAAIQEHRPNTNLIFFLEYLFGRQESSPRTGN